MTPIRLLASVPSRPRNERTTPQAIPRPSTFGAYTTAQTTICGLPSMTLVGVHPLRIPETTRPPMVTPGDRREPGDGPSSNHRAPLTVLAHRRSWVTQPAFPGLPAVSPGYDPFDDVGRSTGVGSEAEALGVRRGPSASQGFGISPLRRACGERHRGYSHGRCYARFRPPALGVIRRTAHSMAHRSMCLSARNERGGAEASRGGGAASQVEGVERAQRRGEYSFRYTRRTAVVRTFGLHPIRLHHFRPNFHGMIRRISPSCLGLALTSVRFPEVLDSPNESPALPVISPSCADLGLFSFAFLFPRLVFIPFPGA